MSLNGQMEFEYDIRMYMYIRTSIQTCYSATTYINSITVAIGQVTEVRLTCEPVSLINWCNATW